MNGSLKIPAEEALRRFIQGAQFLDVRAPIEFNESSVPGSINLPLLTNEERHAVGLLYKEQGQQAAIGLGHQLVSGEIKEDRIQGWRDLCKKQETILFCARGGLRSQITQEWIDRGIPRVLGGYKSIRHVLLEELQRDRALIILAGHTGSGKTEFLNQLALESPVIDLEALANHRGSSFGQRGQVQPAQAVFENAIALEFMGGEIKSEASNLPWILEDESSHIGQCLIPQSLFKRMKLAPRIILEATLEERVQRIWREYILEELKTRDGLEESLRGYLRQSVVRISKSLGGVRSQEILKDIEDSFESKDLEAHQVWIRKLLLWYYDPKYQASLDQPALLRVRWDERESLPLRLSKILN